MDTPRAAGTGPDYSTGRMIALRPPIDLARQAAVDDGLPPEDLHVTLFFLGDPTENVDATPEQYIAALSPLVTEPIPVELTNYDVLGDETEQAYALTGECPELAAFHERAATALNDAGLWYSDKFPVFRPHMTLGYWEDEAPVPREGPVETPVKWAAPRVMLVWGTDEYEIPPSETASVRVAMADPDLHLVAGALGSQIPVRNIPFAYFDTERADAMTKAGTKLAVDLAELPGHVYGIVAPYGVCIRDGQPGCWKVEELRESDPDFAIGKPHQGDTVVVMPDGTEERLATANIGGDKGHSPDEPWMPAASIQSFYENTSTQLARVRYYWGTHGLQATGILWPDAAEPAIVAKIEASPVSLHARPIEDEKGQLGLVGACLVSVPGLPLRRASLTPGEIATRWDGENVTMATRTAVVALADGSYPISDTPSLKRAIAAIGRVGKKGTRRYRRVKGHIIARARDLDAVELLPAAWGVTATTAALRTAALARGAEVEDAEGNTWYVQSQESVSMPDGSNGVILSPVPDGTEGLTIIPEVDLYPTGTEIDVENPDWMELDVTEDDEPCCEECAEMEKMDEELRAFTSAVEVEDPDAIFLATLDADLSAVVDQALTAACETCTSMRKEDDEDEEAY